jgi:hypothetical protein
MATSSKYHLMKRNGRTEGKTGDDDDTVTYTFERGDIIEAPSTEFAHLPDGATEKFDDADKAEAAKQTYLDELGKA